MSKQQHNINPRDGYVLLTAAYNEESYIIKAIQSILEQTLFPISWIIVSDGSTDGTDDIVKRYTADFPFIKLIRKERDPQRKGFQSKVQALKIAYEAVKTETFEFIGHLDADISFGPDYFRSLVERFGSNPTLGISGGFIHEIQGAEFTGRVTNRQYSVAGAIQFFRRQCYHDVGEFLPLEFGGEDWYAEIRARMSGWDVLAFKDLVAYHHKDGSNVRGRLNELLRVGRMDYSLGSHPIFEIFKCVHRIPDPPFLVSSLSRITGYLVEYLSSHHPAVPDDAISYLRKEQLRRLKQRLGIRYSGFFRGIL